MENAQIDAIAVVHGLRLATRNVTDFLNIEGLTVVDPGQAGAS
ncbi:type II toxin-antitoxin system VapC family toxin [Castellaniella defragrans]|nr:type II toxin-antitoxin system VapC family toxin [Castellaniella defragrans]